MVRATFDALKNQMHPKDIASQRGMKYSTLQERRGVTAGAEE
jgi:small subunit ribosomal protein S5